MQFITRLGVICGIIFVGLCATGMALDLLKSDGEEKIRDYLAREQKMVTESLATMRKYDLNIIPAPKSIQVENRQVSLNPENMLMVIGTNRETEIAAEWINKIVVQLGHKAIVVKRASEISDMDRNERYLVLIGGGKENALFREYMKAGLPPDICRAEGYMVKCVGDKQVVLAGYDPQGTIYAAVTFGRLLKAGGAGQLAFQPAEIMDWPDYRYRLVGCLNYPFRRRFAGGKEKDATEGKRMVDFALAYKLNMLWGVQGGPAAHVAGHPRFFTAEQRQWLKEVNEYARERGVRVVLPQSWHIGVSKDDKNKPEYKGCIDQRGGLFCWSRDELLKRKADELVQFFRETGYADIFFHCIDTVNERWDDRCEQCRFAFGNDRAAGDANVINRLYEPLRRNFPDMKIMYVVYSYALDLSQPGMEPQRAFFERLGTLVSNDVYICRREHERKAVAAQKDAMQKPLMLSQEPFYGSAGEQGIFVDNFKYARSYYFNDEDVYFYDVVWPNDHIIALGGAEYSWNVNAPGADDFPTNRAAAVRHLWFEDGQKPGPIQDFILRACETLYGREAGPVLAGLFEAGMNGHYVFDYEKTVARIKEEQSLRPEEYDARCMEQQFAAAEQVVRSLDAFYERVKQGVVTIKPDMVKDRREDFVYFLAQAHSWKAGADVMRHVLHCKEMLEKGENEQALKEISLGNAAVKQGLADLQRLNETLKDETIYSGYKVLSGQNGLKEMEDQLALLEAQTSGRGAKTHSSETLPVKLGKIKVGIYNANLGNGKSYGQNALANTLRKESKMEVAFMASLKPEELKKYDCVIFPDTKMMAAADQVGGVVKQIRDYVASGGGMLFQHDSVGFARFPLGMSLFPEVCANATARIGEYPKSPKYNANDHENDGQLVIARGAGITEGYLAGTKLTHAYYDHIALKAGPEGEVVTRDLKNNPVMVCGRVGQGRVIFDGTILYNEKDEELPEAAGWERDVLVNAVYWLGNGTPVIGVADKKRENKVLSEGCYSFLEFKAALAPVQTLHQVELAAKVYNGDNMRMLLEQKVMTFAELKEAWESKEPVRLKVPEVSKIVVILSLKSDELSVERKIVFENPDGQK